MALVIEVLVLQTLGVRFPPPPCGLIPAAILPGLHS